MGNSPSPSAGAAWHRLPWRGMHKPNPRAGGFLLMLTILVGLVAGIAIGSPITGALIGSAIGIAIAVLVWLVDVRR